MMVAPATEVLMTRPSFWMLIALVTVALNTSVALAVSSDETDARKIMEAVRDQPDAKTMSSDMWMKIQDDTGSSRERVMESRSQKFNDLTKQVSFFKSPPEVRNTGLLTWDYEKSTQADDQWLYLPRMRKLQRIATADKSGSFMGSDFSYSDMTSPAIEDFDYRVVKQGTKAGGDDCWLIESTPRTPKARDETGYVRSMVWISKEKLMPMQVKAQMRAGQRVKYIKFGGFKKVGGVWIAHKIRARTKRGKTVQSTTWLSISNVKVNGTPFAEREFRTERLKTGL
jgi:outer membrane lipoprotein-sorting protein